MRVVSSIIASLAISLSAVAPSIADDSTPEIEPKAEAVRTAEIEPGIALDTAHAPADAPSDDDAAAEASVTTGWFRVDTDSLATQFWLGATHDLGPIAIASDIYVVGSYAEFDIGPSFSVGNLSLTPMIGIGFDFTTENVVTLNAPQLYASYDTSSLYFESWVQLFVNSPFATDAEDSFYTRNFLLYKVADEMQIGPQVEVSYRVNDVESMMLTSGVTSLPVGARVNLGYGKSNTLGIFLGYDTKAASGSDGVAGRFTFVRSW